MAPQPPEASIPTAAPTLSAAERKALRALGHHLDPVVMIGDAGLSAAVLTEVARALHAHELIKIRVLGDDRQARAQMMTDLCAALGCAPVQSIGKLLLVWLPRPAESATREEFRPKKQAAQLAERKTTRSPKAPIAAASRARAAKPAAGRTAAKPARDDARPRPANADRRASPTKAPAKPGSTGATSRPSTRTGVKGVARPGVRAGTRSGVKAGAKAGTGARPGYSGQDGRSRSSAAASKARDARPAAGAKRPATKRRAHS